MSKQRVVAVQIAYQVVFKQSNLTEQFKQRLLKSHTPEFKSAVKAICYETIRHYQWLEDWWLKCVDKKPKDKLVRVVLCLALAEYKFLNKPAHVIVNEAINTAKKLKKPWASSLINACLRTAVDLTNEQASNEVAQYSHPLWWIEKLKKDWPEDWQQLLIANNQKPPLWVRANSTITLDNPHSSISNAYKIQPQDIKKNNDFVAGLFSVQDASAQLATHILKPCADDFILDMCAAPGGKTCHILELGGSVKLDALELFPNRAKKIHENLSRLKLKANVITADATDLGSWFDGIKYNKVLLDAPCSASGVVRRQPDIKFQRTEKDLDDICQTQQKLLNSAAEVLNENGMLLYATCSVFQQENSEQIQLFLKSHPEFKEIKLKYPFAINCQHGIQILTGAEDMDGFYYCLITKSND